MLSERSRGERHPSATLGVQFSISGCSFSARGAEYFYFLILEKNTPSKQTAGNVRASTNQANHLHAWIDDSIV